MASRRGISTESSLMTRVTFEREACFKVAKEAIVSFETKTARLLLIVSLSGPWEDLKDHLHIPTSS